MSLYKTNLESLLRPATKLVIGIALLLPLISACGFHAVYSQNKGGEGQNLPVFKTISIDDIPNKSGQDLRNDLYDILNPTSLEAEKKYHLEIKLKRDIIPLIIEKDRSITRYSLVYVATIKLYEIGKDKALYDGTARVEGSYDAVNSDYAVYMAEGDTGSRILKEMAEDQQ